MYDCTVPCLSFGYPVAMSSVANEGRKNAVVPPLMSVMLTYWYNTDAVLFCANSFSPPLSVTENQAWGS